jgi:hypothetical protein
MLLPLAALAMAVAADTTPPRKDWQTRILMALPEVLDLIDSVVGDLRPYGERVSIGPAPKTLVAAIEEASRSVDEVRTDETQPALPGPANTTSRFLRGPLLVRIALLKADTYLRSANQRLLQPKGMVRGTLVDEWPKDEIDLARALLQHTVSIALAPRSLSLGGLGDASTIHEALRKCVGNKEIAGTHDEIFLLDSLEVLFSELVAHFESQGDWDVSDEKTRVLISPEMLEIVKKALKLASLETTRQILGGNPSRVPDLEKKLEQQDRLLIEAALALGPYPP